MRWLFRTTLNVALTIAPFLGSGCTTQALQINNPPQQAHQDAQKMTAQQMLIAQREEAAGNLVEARKLYTRIHQANPDHAECAHRLGLLYVKLNLLSQADVYYQKALAISPNDSRMLTDAGHLAFLKKDYVQSEEYLVRATNADSTNRAAAYNLAVVRAWLEEDESSLATFRNIVDEHNALRNLATIQIARGDKSLGMESMKLAEIASRTPDATAARNPETSNSTQLISARQPELSGAPPLLNSLPEALPTARPQPPLQASTSGIHRGSSNLCDTPPAPAMSPTPSPSALPNVHCKPTAIARCETPSSSAVADVQPKTVSVMPEPHRKESPALVATLDIPRSEPEQQEIQFELPYRSSLQLDGSDEERLPWEILKTIELKEVQ